MENFIFCAMLQTSETEQSKSKPNRKTWVRQKPNWKTWVRQTISERFTTSAFQTTILVGKELDFLT